MDARVALAIGLSVLAGAGATVTLFQRAPHGPTCPGTATCAIAPLPCPAFAQKASTCVKATRIHASLAGCTDDTAILALPNAYRNLPPGYVQGSFGPGTYNYVLDIVSCPDFRLDTGTSGTSLGAVHFALAGPSMHAAVASNASSFQTYAIEAYTDSPQFVALGAYAGADWRRANFTEVTTPVATTRDVMVNGTIRYSGVWQTTRQMGSAYFGPLLHLLPAPDPTTYLSLNASFQHLSTSGTLRMSSGPLLEANDGSQVTVGLFDARKFLDGTFSYAFLAH